MMGMFSGRDLKSEKYILSLINKIKLKTPIKMKDGNEYILEYSDNIKKLEEFSNNYNLLIEIIKNKDRFILFFKEINSDKMFKWNDIDKAPFSGFDGKTNRNCLGKDLADAGERATIKSIIDYSNDKLILLPSDTNEDFFINNLDLFNIWKNTFVQTPILISELIGGKDKISEYYLEHDADTKNKLNDIIIDITKVANCSKNSWNPADVWLIKKKEYDSIIRDFKNILYNTDNPPGIIDINNLIKNLYDDRLLYPISLKQIGGGKGNIEITNYTYKPISYKFEMVQYPSGFAFNNDTNQFCTKEIGLFIAKNLETDNHMVFQMRAFPHGFKIAQTEITTSGEDCGGRVGKIPTKDIDYILAMYGSSRFKSIKELNNFEWDNETKQYYSDMYFSLTNSNYFSENINYWIELTKIDDNVKEDLSVKIQGLKMSYFLWENKEHISDILTRFLLAGKKINQSSSMFIKIY